MVDNRIFLSLRNIAKSYPGVKALNNINIDINKGEILGVVGENGAGKSTLIKIITGAIQADKGEILIEGKPYISYSPHEALFDFGIIAIYQEFNLVSSLSITENIFLGREMEKNLFLDCRQMEKATRKILSDIGFSINPKRTIKELSVAEQQIVEIAKALSYDVKLLIMDEPTAPLMPNEVAQLFKLIDQLKSRGVSVIYISHRLEEALNICERIIVMRDGNLIKKLNTKETDRKELISLMVGRKLGQEYPSREGSHGDVLLSVRHVSTSLIRDICFDLHAGEIFGIAGLVGSGRTEIANAIFGIDRIHNGEIFLRNKKVKICNPLEAMRLEIGLIPEDRKRSGILGKMSVKQNISFSILPKLTNWFFINEQKENKVVDEFIDRLKIKTPDKDKQVQFLSGGNQQKVVLSKMLASDCEIIIFDEPTRGIDVGAKHEIYSLMNQLSNTGKGIIMISSDLPELLNMADRIMVMNSGCVKGFVEKENATQDYILDLASIEC